MTGRFAFLALVAGLGAVTGLAAGRSQGADTMPAAPSLVRAEAAGIDLHRAGHAPEGLLPPDARRAAAEAAVRATMEPRPAADLRLARLAGQLCPPGAGGEAGATLTPARNAPCDAEALPSPDRVVVE